MINEAFTFHAPAYKLDLSEVRDQACRLRNNPLFKQTFDSINIMVLILNPYRQLVFANKTFLDALGINSINLIIGRRPGEVIQCIHANDNAGGCGTSEACRYCNAVNLTLKSIETGSESSGEVVITSNSNGLQLPLNLFESVHPITIDEEMFFIVTLMDVSSVHQRRILEKTFFHDIINTSGALMGLVELLKNDVPEPLKAEVQFVEEAFSGLLDEIMAQKQILDAESNELKINLTTLNTEELIRLVAGLYQNHEAARQRTIIIADNSENLYFKSDFVLMKRILSNMMKNALEASQVNGKVTIGCRKVKSDPAYLEFWVHNEGCLPKEAQMRVFQRFFSTKGAGRGLGTYSMKLFGERYLKGEVGYTTDEIRGTMFFIRQKLE